MFMEIAVGAIGIGIVLMIGYLVLSQVNDALVPSSLVSNPCYQQNTTAGAACAGWDNTTALMGGNATNGLTSTMTTVFAGFGLVAVGIIVLAAFGLINIFK